MARDDLDVSAQLGYLLRAVEELTTESKLLRNDLKAHMEEEIEIKRAMDARVADLEMSRNRVKLYISAVGGICTLLGFVIGTIVDVLY